MARASRAIKTDREDIETSPRYDDDVIVLNKWWVISAGVALVFFVLGMAAGYFMFNLTLDQRLAEVAALAAAGQGGGGSGAAAQAPQPAARLDNVDADDDPAFGPENAPVTIVEFSDFQCPYCSRFRSETMDALVEEYGDLIRFVYRDFPLTSIHPQAMEGAMAGECADEQGKFWEMHDLIFANQVSMGVGQSLYVDFAGQLNMDVEQFQACMNNDEYAEEIANDMADASSYGVSGTPTFFINGVRLIGAQPLAAFQAVINQELDR